MSPPSSRSLEGHALEARVAKTVIPALEARADALPSTVTDRLAKARQAALQRQKLPVTAQEVVLAPAFAGHSSFSSDIHSHSSETSERSHPILKRLRRLGLFWPLLVLLAGLLGIAEWQQASQIDDLADIDSELLIDDLPPQAYSDPGFKAFLNDEH
jgi:Protein of unknown function (DUF3619)